jgi:hypothetical protein
MLAFDSKDYIRRKVYQTQDIVTQEPITIKDTVYYSPIGVGVKFGDHDAFKTVCLKRVEELANSFQIPDKRIMYDSTSLKQLLTPGKALPFCDQLITKLKRYIDSLTFTYVVMPPQEHPTVTVGGNKSPAYDIKSAEFVRCLGPMFTHIAAWSYFGIPREPVEEMQLDGFYSKTTQAWNDLLSHTKPKIFPHGDECNPYIMIADIIAYLTDTKLYIQRKNLRRENLQEIWEPYGFHVESHFLNYDTCGKYAWNSEEMIDTAPYLAHPIVFLLADSLEMLQPHPKTDNQEQINEESQEEQNLETLPKNMKSVVKEAKFRKIVRRMEPWYAVTAYAYSKGGSALLFDYYIDNKKVREGDTMVYIGNKSKEMVEGFNDIFDIEVLSAKELRKNVNRLKGKSETH